MKERISYQEISPQFFNGLNQSEKYLKSTGFDLGLLELIKYRVSQINGCAYCLDMHFQEARHLGVSELHLYSVSAWSECPFYSEKEKAVLAFAEALTNISQQDIDHDLYEQLIKFYSKEEIATLALAVSQINTWNRINRTFLTESGKYRVGQYA